MAPLYIRRNIADVLEVCKILTNKAFHPKNPFVVSRQNRHPYRLVRQPHQYDNKNWFYPRSEKLWNSLSNRKTVIDKIEPFKSLIEHLLCEAPHLNFMS